MATKRINKKKLAEEATKVVAKTEEAAKAVAEKAGEAVKNTGDAIEANMNKPEVKESPAKTTTTFLIVDTMRKETTRRQLVITLTANSADALRLKMERLSRLTVILMTTANPSLPQKNGLCQMKVLEKG